MLFVASVFKGITINKKMRLDHELLSNPETDILKYHEYKSSLVDNGRYLLSCYRYIELNPVRAGIVKQPDDYVYSSYHANALGKPDLMVTPHCEFEDFIGNSKFTMSDNVNDVKVSESKKIDSDTFNDRHLYVSRLGVGVKYT